MKQLVDKIQQLLDSAKQLPEDAEERLKRVGSKAGVEVGSPKSVDSQISALSASIDHLKQCCDSQHAKTDEENKTPGLITVPGQPIRAQKEPPKTEESPPKEKK